MELEIHTNSTKILEGTIYTASLLPSIVEKLKKTACLEIFQTQKAVSVKAQLNVQSYWNVKLLLKCQIQVQQELLKSSDGIE